MAICNSTDRPNDDLTQLRRWAPGQPDPGRQDATAWYVVHDVEDAGCRIIGKPVAGPFHSRERAQTSLEVMRNQVPAAYISKHVIEAFPETGA